MLMLHLTVE